MDETAIEWLRERLLAWYKHSGRSFPWRETDEPFKVLIAEMMLRRTWANQVVPVFNRFFEKYSDCSSAHDADPQEVCSILQSLGLQRRTTDIIAMMHDLATNFNCVVPDTREELKQLTGVGDYVAGAVLSIAFAQPEWIIDTNVLRVFQRFFGLPRNVEARRQKSMIVLAKAYSSTEQARDANLAVLDHAALVCRHRDPTCNICPLRSRCVYFGDQVARRD